MLKNGTAPDESAWGRAFIEALPKLPEVLRIRADRMKASTVADLELLS